MDKFVLDCSIAAGWLFESQTTKLNELTLQRLSEGNALAIVPPLFELELVNIMLVQIRRNKLNLAAALEFFSELKNLPIVTKIPPTASPQSLLTFALQTPLSSYDAHYLELAIAEALPLASRDTMLCDAAKSIGIALYSGRNPKN